MREIKFRAWNILTNQMIDLKKITPLALNIDTDGLFIPFSDGLPLMQFTGFQDKTGKDIYEGDIVVDWNTGKEGVHSAPYEIKFHHWSLETLFSDQFSVVEVIGNIYENLELLNAA